MAAVFLDRRGFILGERGIERQVTFEEVFALAGCLTVSDSREGKRRRADLLQTAALLTHPSKLCNHEERVHRQAKYALFPGHRNTCTYLPSPTPMN